ncbi:hypothetical protein ACHHYP_04488 [Achlya hypogyna]|uniref:PX domain-containing protein n=1 Tax=Achlya hypogyna TaxID=1202772 RepID=A0A1V9Z1G9_ACHHY|nr:hypothetical protein ACHHYP_04488 [Achlya hypogyna]
MVILEVAPTGLAKDERFAINLHDVSVHIMDYVVEQGVVFYKVEVCDEHSGDAIVILRRYRDMHRLRQLFLKDLDYYCHCPDNTCEAFLNDLKGCRFPKKSWFRRDSEVRATVLSNFLRDLVALAQRHPPLCRANQKVVHAALKKFLSVPTLLAYGPNRCESATTQLTTPSSSSARSRAGSTPVPVTTKRLIL